jgi:hypothetical protein
MNLDLAHVQLWPAIVAVSMQSDALFPLTLTLSLRERERFSAACEYSGNSGHFLALPMVLPLPKGEGWGEGEGRFLMHGSGLAQVSNPLWDSNVLGNPKGIASFSPGLRGTSYPGFQHPKDRQPCKGCITVSSPPVSLPGRRIDNRMGERRSNPFRVGSSSGGIPRVARASQPWAERFHPFRMPADWPRL